MLQPDLGTIAISHKRLRPSDDRSHGHVFCFCRIRMVEWMMCQLKLGRHRAEEHLFLWRAVESPRNPSDIFLIWMNTFSWHRVRCTKDYNREMCFLSIHNQEDDAGILWTSCSCCNFCRPKIPFSILKKTDLSSRHHSETGHWHCNGDHVMACLFSHWLADPLTSWYFLGQNSNLFIV